MKTGIIATECFTTPRKASKGEKKIMFQQQGKDTVNVVDKELTLNSH